MDNQLQKPIGGLRLPVPMAEQYRDMRHKKLIDLIDKPQHGGLHVDGDGHNQRSDDAKYYNIQFEHNKKLCGQPGIESITKQYLYQLAYQPFVETHQISTVRNCFLIPTASSDVIEKRCGITWYVAESWITEYSDSFVACEYHV